MQPDPGAELEHNDLVLERARFRGPLAALEEHGGRRPRAVAVVGDLVGNGVGREDYNDSG